ARGVRGIAPAPSAGACADLGIAALGREPVVRLRPLRPARPARVGRGEGRRPRLARRHGTRLLLRAGAVAMVTSDGAYLVLVALVACQRVAELRLSRINAGRPLARGGVEYGRGH